MESLKLRGIDISYHNGEIDFQKVKPNVDFIIMRAGYGTKREDSKEVKFESYYNEAKKLNIPVGTYWYCYAKNPDEALLEAKTCLDKIKGKQFEFPVFYDVEEGKILQTARENVSAIIKTFLGELENNGYFCGVYSSASHLETYLTDDIRNKYEMWVAHWGVQSPRYNGKWGVWQYTSNGTMDGISGRVDLDYAIINYEQIIKSLHKNGF